MIDMGNLHNYKRRGREYLVNSKRGVYNGSRTKSAVKSGDEGNKRKERGRGPGPMPLYV
jgi:hypothetical protein